jgi:hypothetical protein
MVEEQRRRGVMEVAHEASRRQWRRAIPVALLLVLGAGGAIAAWASSGSGPSSSPGPEGVRVYDVPDLAPATTTVSGTSVDGVTCQTQSKEVVKYHIHIYVSVYVDGKRLRVPAGVGMTQPSSIQHYSTGPYFDVGLYNCLYWIHTHVNDGVIHVEAPMKRPFTLGQFFDVWGQSLGARQAGPAHGPVVVFENGRRLTRDPRATPLMPHGVIQIDVGSPVVAFQPVTYKVSGGCGQGTLGCSTPKKK